ncbi:hypothetical protein CHS0354_042140 [Potamilus streckersoni]|uniref:Uncharacterized protein n=1 Tax=Potamilus streckersoni TaxID=2493646 RepID=A0AAE0WGH1_9BIVA|nr:hypothetical protein CHS0354_042140 [Potamilus streckersoni]
MSSQADKVAWKIGGTEPFGDLCQEDRKNLHQGLQILQKDGEAGWLRWNFFAGGLGWVRAGPGEVRGRTANESCLDDFHGTKVILGSLFPAGFRKRPSSEANCPLKETAVQAWDHKQSQKPPCNKFLSVDHLLVVVREIFEV